MPHLLDPQLVKTYELDRQRLAKTKLPIITVSGTFREDLKRMYGLPDDNKINDVVFSRAHFSMALGIAMQAWENKIQPEKAWMVDPTNYVSAENWSKISFTEQIAKTIARQSFLKKLKDFIDRFGRGKLPILSSITPPLLHLTEDITAPILSLHIAAGNILAEHGKKVIQVVTDPHVRPEYVTHANKPNTRYCVFDERTKLEFLEVAAIHGVAVHPDKVIVTGPPVDPRILAGRKNKTAWRSGPLRLVIATGGLGTNKYEIRLALLQLLPELRKHSSTLSLVVYAGTQKDIYEMVKTLAHEHHVSVGEMSDKTAKLRILYHPQIFDANELLITFGFPWADGFITKPSGDMAYDAVAAGCFLLTLQEWGVWEERVREVFEQKDISHRANIEHIVQQLEVLKSSTTGQSWIEKAMNRAFGIEKLFLLGSQKIISATREWKD